MLAIGIDPGTATTGFGLVRIHDGGELEWVAHGALLTRAGLEMGTRLEELHQALRRLLALHRPDSAAVEKLFFQKNVSTALSVGQARGVVLLALAEANIPTDEYTPREVKMAVSGYGSARKRQMQNMVKTLLGLEDVPKPDDAADALAVAICHVHTLRVRSRMEAAQ